MPKQQRARTPKTSSGLGIKHKKSPQTPVALVIMGKGQYVGIHNRLTRIRSKSK